MHAKPSTPRTEVLDSRECWELLRGVSLGRIAVWTGERPEIFPLTYLTDRETIVFRTGPGTKLSAVLRASPVALEADSVDSRANVAWSVVVKGQASAIEETDGFRATAASRLLSWEPGSKDTFVRIVPEEVTGRRFKVGTHDDWGISLDDATRSGLD